MHAWTAFATLDDEDRARALGEALEAAQTAGVGVFEMEDGSGRWEVAGYFDGAPDAVSVALLEAAFAVAFTLSEVPDTDWVAKVRRDLSPVEAGRFFLYGSHDADRVPAGRVPLLIEAAMAFGTGHHGTTLGCLQAFDALFEAGLRPARVADIGCGTAVLAMAAAKILPDAAILAADIDPVAIEVARANLAANGIDGVACVEAPGFDHPAIAAAAPFDLIFANILKGPLLDLAPAMADHLSEGGRLILSGLLNDQAEDVTQAYAAVGMTGIAVSSIGDWTTLVLGRVSA